MSWRPLPSVPARALEAACNIAGDLASPDAFDNGSLAYGNAGASLLFATLDRASIDMGNAFDPTDVAIAHLERAFELATASANAHELHKGLCGVGWVAAHLQRIGWLDDDPCAEIDRMLLEALEAQQIPSHGLSSGLAGVGVYALERDCEPLIAAVARELERRVDGDAGWPTAPEQLSESRRKKHPSGCYDLGVAFGNPGTLSVLARIAARGDARSARVRDRVFAWLLSKQQGSEFGLFASGVSRAAEPPAQPVPMRVAWCYGDSGVGCALSSAGTESMKEAARRIGLNAVKRASDGQRPADAFLCHGTSGLLLAFQHFWNATGDAEFADAANHWLLETFTDLESGFGAEPTPLTNSFLVGRAGVALALIAAATDLPPQWDRCLLFSV